MVHVRRLRIREGVELSQDHTKAKDLSGEIAQRLRILAALPEDPSSIPSTHMAAHNCL